MNTEHFFIMRSQTSAIKAKRLLSARGITSTAFKSTSENGCSYGILVAKSDYNAAHTALIEGGIQFSVSDIRP